MQFGGTFVGQMREDLERPGLFLSNVTVNLRCSVATDLKW
jgi:hypothetical protein